MTTPAMPATLENTLGSHLNRRFALLKLGEAVFPMGGDPLVLDESTSQDPVFSEAFLGDTLDRLGALGLEGVHSLPPVQDFGPTKERLKLTDDKGESLEESDLIAVKGGTSIASFMKNLVLENSHSSKDDKVRLGVENQDPSAAPMNGIGVDGVAKLILTGAIGSLPYQAAPKTAHVVSWPGMGTLTGIKRMVAERAERKGLTCHESEASGDRTGMRTHVSLVTLRPESFEAPPVLSDNGGERGLESPSGGLKDVCGVLTDRIERAISAHALVVVVVDEAAKLSDQGQKFVANLIDRGMVVVLFSNYGPEGQLPVLSETLASRCEVVVPSSPMRGFDRNGEVLAVGPSDRQAKAGYVSLLDGSEATRLLHPSLDDRMAERRARVKHVSTNEMNNPETSSSRPLKKR